MNVTRTFQYAARALSRSKGLAILAVLTLAMGIGSTTFMFSIVHGALYRGLPFPDGDEIVRVFSTDRGGTADRMSVSLHDFVDMRAEQSSFAGFAAGYSGTLNVGLDNGAIRMDGGFLTADAFSVLRVQPALGRGFLPGDDTPGAEPVLVLGHRVWQDRFGGDPNVLGRAVRVNGRPSTVVGVMPEGFAFPETQEAWIPMQQDPVALERGGGVGLNVFGRLRDGVSREQAQAELAAIAARLEAEYPEANENRGVNIAGYTEMDPETTGVLFAMLGAVALILVVACINVANLLLARTATRTREIAMRTALGAGRGRLIGQLIAEAGVLALAGAALGTALTWVAMGWFRNAVVNTDPPFWFVFDVDGPILLFVAGVAALAAVLSGVIPGLKATGGDVQSLLQDDSRGSSSLRIGRLSKALVVGEIALSMGLLVVAGLMAKGIIERRNLDLPFPTAEVFSSRIGLFESEYPDVEARQRFYDDLLLDLNADPAIQRAALTVDLPGDGSTWGRAAIQGRAYDEPRDYPETRWSVVTPGFFDIFEAGALRGRLLDERDRAGADNVVVINQSFADELFEGEDPLGQQVRMAGGDRDEEPVWRTVVGVVPDLGMNQVNNQDNPVTRGFYMPLAQNDARFIHIIARPVPQAAADPMALTPNVRRAVQRLSPDTPLYWVWTVQEEIDRELWVVDVFGAIMITFGFIALVMAVAGLYGVTAFTVGRRTHEVGIRMAMGAASRDVMGLILKQGAIQIVIGLGIGLGLATGLAVLMQQILFRVEPMDPLVYGGITLILTVTAFTASAIPALRASRTDPALALRRD